MFDTCCPISRCMATLPDRPDYGFLPEIQWLCAVGCHQRLLSWGHAQNLGFFLGIRSARSRSLILAARMKSLSVSPPEQQNSPKSAYRNHSFLASVY